MAAPIIGAGIGAVASLATGRDPLQGALLGGISGGFFGGSQGFGSGFKELGGLFDLGSMTSAIPEVATQGAAQSAMTAGAPSSLLSGGGLNIDMGLNPLNVGMGGTTATQAGYQAASPFGSVLDIPETAAASGLSTGGGYVPSPTELETAANINQFGGLTATPKTSLLEDIGTTAYEGLSGMNPMEQFQLAQTGLDAFTPEEQQQIQAQLGQISPAKEVKVGKPIAINIPNRTFKPRFA